MKDLNAILDASKAGDVIALDGGAYYLERHGQGTAGGSYVKNGCTIRGNGSTVFIETSYAAGDIDCLFGEGSFTVENLTLDCNGLSSHTYKRNGIVGLAGCHNLANVTVLRTVGFWSSQREGFSVLLQGDKARVTGCTVADVRGSYVNGYNVKSGLVQNSKVIFPETHNVNDAFFAFNFQDAADLVYDYCVAHNPTVGFYSDTGSSARVTLQNCDLLDTESASNFQQGQPGQSLSFISVLNTYVRLRSGAVQAWVASQAHASNTMANMVWRDCKVDGAGLSYQANLSAISSGSINLVTVAGNTFQSTLPVRNAGGRATNLTFNTFAVASGSVVTV